MNLFDSLISEINCVIDEFEIKELPITSELIEDVGKDNFIFQDESAFELGSDNKSSLSFELITSSELITDDEIILIGKDLNEITEDVSFSRISLVKTKANNLSGNELYDFIEKVKFSKYRVSPKGYMLRTARNNKEKVRVSKTLKEAGSFSKIGSAYVKAYKQIPDVISVKEIFIVDNDELIEKLHSFAERKDLIVDTIDHILKGMMLNDCESCGVKELCDEVEGLRELHKFS